MARVHSRRAALVASSSPARTPSRVMSPSPAARSSSRPMPASVTPPTPSSLMGQSLRPPIARPFSQRVLASPVPSRRLVRLPSVAPTTSSKSPRAIPSPRPRSLPSAVLLARASLRPAAARSSSARLVSSRVRVRSPIQASNGRSSVASVSIRVCWSSPTRRRLPRIPFSRSIILTTPPSPFRAVSRSRTTSSSIP